MKVIQLVNSEGDYAGLYVTERTDSNVEKDIEETFQIANEEARNNINLFAHGIADEYLEKKDIHRVFAEEVYVDIL